MFRFTEKTTSSFSRLVGIELKINRSYIYRVSTIDQKQLQTTAVFWVDELYIMYIINAYNKNTNRIVYLCINCVRVNV